jgi:hypothetical protein
VVSDGANGRDLKLVIEALLKRGMTETQVRKACEQALNAARRG